MLSSRARRVGGGVITGTSVLGFVGLPEDVQKLGSLLAFIGDGGAGWIVPTLLGLALLLLPTDTLERAKREREGPSRNGKARSVEVTTQSGAADPGSRPQQMPTVEPAADSQATDVTPVRLTGFFENRTDIQAQRTVEPFIGKWMTVSGPLGNVSAFKTISQVTFAPETFDSTTVYMYFKDRETVETRLYGLKSGDQLTVRGRIDKVTSHSVDLEDCELVD